MTDDNRAVSTTIGYVLTLGISTLLITGLLIAGGSFLEDHRDETTRTELTVVGQQIAGLVTSADGLAKSSTVGRFNTTRSLPSSVSGSSYVVRIRNVAPDEYEFELEADNGVSETVRVTTQTTVVVPRNVVGGDLRVHYNTTGDELVVHNA
jgi:hypothetical protein